MSGREGFFPDRKSRFEIGPKSRTPVGFDFSIFESDISFSNDPEKEENTTITAKIKGSGKRWSSYQVEVEFIDGSKLIEAVKATISRGVTNEVSVLWVPEDDGLHSITINIDPEDDIGETDEGNNEATKMVEVKEDSGGGTPGFEVGLVVSALLVAFVSKMSKKRR